MSQSVPIGPFVVDQRIGEGGMGAVYRGRHRETGVPVAFKVIHRRTTGEARRHFHEEVQAHAGLRHPGIVYLFEYGEVPEGAARSQLALREGSPYVAMELADRGTVRDAMPLNDWTTVCRLLVQTLDALAYSHARGVIHRDLKPENLLVFRREPREASTAQASINLGATATASKQPSRSRRAGRTSTLDSDAGEPSDAAPDRGSAPPRIKLADFGVAHAFDREREAGLDELQAAAGTPLYMAPEQLRGRWRAYGPCTDLYAVGCICWEFVCGRPPFDGDSALAIARQHGNEPRPPLAPRFPVPDGLEAWIHRAMAVDPERRFQRAADAAWTLPRGVLAESDGGAGRETLRGTPAEGTGPPEAGEGGETTDALAETQTVTLAATVLLDEQGTVAPSEESSGTTSSGSGGTDAEMGRAETAPVVSSDGALAPEDQGALANRILETLHPPVPEDWRPHQTDPLPAPLVGTGLGLFGLREPPFVNRTEEVDEIWEALHRVVEEGKTESVFVAGEAGTGKSRLAEWFATRAHEVGAARVIRAVHTPSGAPNEGLRAAFEQTLRTLKMDRGEVYDYLLERLAEMGGGGAVSVEREARALTEYLRPTDDRVEEVDGPRYRFPNARQRRAQVVRILERLAGRRPLVLWLDDLQWGAEALGVVEQLQEMSDDPPSLLVVATLRSDVLADRPRIERRIAELEAASSSRRLNLEPLSRAYQRELLEGLLPLESQLADRLADRTEGHPLFAMQLLGHWIEQGDIEVGAEGFQVPDDRGIELPEDIHELWMERIDRLLELFSAEVGAVLEMAAALGREVDGGEWRAVLEEAGMAVPTRLVDRLVERGLVERTAEGWAFAHGLLVDSLERRAREAGRWKGHHRRCARVLSSILDDVSGHGERVAKHWVEGGEKERALAPLLDDIHRAVDLSDDDRRRQLLDWRAELFEELDVSDEAPLWFEQRVERARLLMDLGGYEEARDILSEVWGGGDADNDHLRGQVSFLMAGIQRTVGRRDEALEWGERALEAARRAGDDKLVARAHRQLAWTRRSQAKYEAAERHAESSRELAERAGDHHGQLDALRLLAQLYRGRGDERAVELLERVRREAAEAGYLMMEAVALNDLGDYMRFAGRLEEARRYYGEYTQMLKQVARPVLKLHAGLNLAQLELRAGNFERAHDHLRFARRMIEQSGAEDYHVGVRCVIRLTHAAGVEDASRFRESWSRLADGWPEDWRLAKDHPWLLEAAGDYAREAGWPEAAEEVWRLARDLWRELDDAQAAEALQERIDGLQSGRPS